MDAAPAAATPRPERRALEHGARERGGPPGELVLARIAGVEIAADWSLLVIFALVTVQLGAGVLPRWHPGWSSALVWSVAILASGLFFVSIALHELSHAIVARLNGIKVRRISLFLFGGIARLEGEPRSPLAELLTAVVGPIVSLAIGIGATALGIALSGDALAFVRQDAEPAYRALGPLATLLLWLGPANVVLAVFNLVPGFPLDGGRVLRALLWWSTGDLRRATRWASGAGSLVGLGLVALGVFSMLEGSFGSGLWLALIGWFLHSAARASYEQLVVGEALAGVPLQLVMRSALDVVRPDITLEELVHRHLMQSDQLAFPVIESERLVGLVCLSDVRKVRREDWPATRVEAAMTPAHRLVTLDPRAPASEALRALAEHEIDQLPVVEDGRLLGMVRRRDIMRWLALTEGRVPA